MKTVHKIIFAMAISCLTLFLSIASFSQEIIEVKTEKAVMSQGMQNGYAVNIPMGILKDVQTNWIKKLQENIKTKVTSIDDELVLSNAVISEITSDTISVYSLIIDKETSVTLIAFIKIDTVFFSPKEDKSQLSAEKTDSAIKKYIRDFAVEQYRLFAQKDLEAEEKILDGLENDHENIGKEIDNFKKDISSLENQIEKTEREIASLDQEIEIKNQEVLAHKTSMQSLSTEIEKKAAQDKDKELEKEKKKLEKDRVDAKNDISDMKSDIEKNEKNISENEKLMEEKTEEISLQKEEVAKAQKLLEGIK